MKPGLAFIKGKFMKIDTSTITMAADIRHSKTTRAERAGTVQYWRIEDPDTIVLEKNTYAAAEETALIHWSESKTVNNKTGPGEEEEEKSNPFNDSYNLQMQLSHLDTYLDEDTFNRLSERAVRILDMTRMMASFESPTSGEDSQVSDTAALAETEVPADQSVLAAEIEKIAELMEKAQNEINDAMQPLVLNMPMFFVCDLKCEPVLSGQQLLSGINPSHARPLDLGTYGYAVEEETRLTYEETEQVRFTADGVVRTQDGQEVSFTLGLELDRHLFMEADQTLFETGTFTRTLDPLVINLDGGIPELADFTFGLDLDLDGEEETIQGLAQGSGYLCFDRNGDGIINDGSELFGPATNNGFEELSQYDSDNNLWIDENDAIWDELAYWESDGESGMRLTKLSDTGLGAIYLDHMDTPFNMTDGEGNLKARITDSGIALNEDGSAASVQEIHWVV